MPQMRLPLIPGGATTINDILSVAKEDGKWFYFCGVNPVFFHKESDIRSFRMYTAQLVYQGICKQAEVIRAFGVSKNSVNRSVKKYREEGPGAFFAPRKGRGGSVLTDEVKTTAQQLLNLGKTKDEVADELAVKRDTLRKAISQRRLFEPKETKTLVASDKSTRTGKDAAAEMGTACTRPVERVAAAVGLLTDGASTSFEPSLDVSFGGVLCALPALIAGGLLSHVEECFKTHTAQIKEAPKHMNWADLKPEDKFEKLKPSRKCLTDTIKMIAYRAETAMVNIVREELSRKDDARALIRDLCKSEADILPEIDAGVLTIQIHHMANPRMNRAIEHLLTSLNETAFNYPGTNLRLYYRMASPSLARRGEK